MNDTLTPPPAGPAPEQTRPVAPRDPGPGKAVSVVLIVIGSLVLGGTVIGAVRGAVAQANRVSDTLTADVAGIRELDVDVSASDFTIEYGDVDEATLAVSESRSTWRLERDGDELSVGTDHGLGGWSFWRGGWDWGWGAEEKVVLTLPERTTLIDADLSIGGGSLTVDELAFGELSIDLGAGELDVTGSADTLDLEVGAGDARVELDGVTDGTIGISAGRLEGELTGDAPTRLAVSVSAGSLELALPKEAYDVRSDVSAGDFDNRLETEAGSAHAVTVDVSAGRVVLR